MELIPAEGDGPFANEMLHVKDGILMLGRIECVDNPTRANSRWWAYNSNGFKSGPYSKTGALDWVVSQYK